MLRGLFLALDDTEESATGGIPPDAADAAKDAEELEPEPEPESLSLINGEFMPRGEIGKGGGRVKMAVIVRGILREIAVLILQTIGLVVVKRICRRSCCALCLGLQQCNQV